MTKTPAVSAAPLGCNTCGHCRDRSCDLGRRIDRLSDLGSRCSAYDARGRVRQSPRFDLGSPRKRP